MIRIRFGIVLRINEITTFENAVIMVTESPITMAGSSFEVTASAEQIPSTCTVTGLFMLIGLENTSLFLAENKFPILISPPIIL